MFIIHLLNSKDVVSIFFFVLLGIVQGILEWLPVSSEGQIVFIAFLFSDLDNLTILSLSFWLHLGTMFSVLFLYREEWIQIFKFQNKKYGTLRRFLLLTTIGTAIVGIPIRTLLLRNLENSIVGELIMWILALALIFTGLLLHFSKKSENGFKSLDTLSWYQMVIIGFAQGITVIPGVSRSGTTISVILMHKIETEDAFRGSFFISVPAVLGAVSLDLLDVIRGQSTGIFSLNMGGVILAILLAFVFGLLTIKTMLSVARNYSFAHILLGFALTMILFLLIF